jgi:hypothetical protein
LRRSVAAALAKSAHCRFSRMAPQCRFCAVMTARWISPSPISERPCNAAATLLLQERVAVGNAQRTGGAKHRIHLFVAKGERGHR